MRAWTWLDDLGMDLRYTGKMLRANPLFTVIAVLTLALGIGANTAVFSVMNAVVLRSLPVRDPQQLVYLRTIPNQPDGASNTGNGDSSFSEYVFEQLRGNHHVFSNLMAYVPLGLDKISVRSGKVPEEEAADMVSGNFFSGIGVQAICGWTLTPADENSHSAFAVLSYAYWSRRFGQSCGVLGQPLYIKGVPFTIAGVAAQGFTGVESTPTDIWIPLQTRPELNAWGMRGSDTLYGSPNWWCLMLLGRMSSGVTETQARAELNPAFLRAAYEHLGGKPRPGERPPSLSFVHAHGIPGAQEAYEKPLSILLVMVGLVLVIACGNVSLLLAARNTARQREFSIRMALGGSRLRLFRQLFAESLLLVFAGALFGWIFAMAATNALAAWSGMQVNLAPDTNVLLFTLAISLLAGIVFGLGAATQRVACANQPGSKDFFRDGVPGYSQITQRQSDCGVASSPLFDSFSRRGTAGSYVTQPRKRSARFSIERSFSFWHQPSISRAFQCGSNPLLSRVVNPA